jgi:Spy/CpxP family protein refolding chaperone
MNKLTMNKLLTVTLVGSTLLAASVWAARLEGGAGPQGHGRRGLDVVRIQAELGLSDDQVGQLQKLKRDGRSQMIQHRASLRIAEGELQDLLRAPAVDENAISAKVKQVTDLQAAGTQARVARRLALRRVLTPEQLTKFDSLGPARGTGGGPRRHRGPRGPGPDDPADQPHPGNDSQR